MSAIWEEGPQKDRVSPIRRGTPIRQATPIGGAERGEEEKEERENEGYFPQSPDTVATTTETEGLDVDPVTPALTELTIDMEREAITPLTDGKAIVLAKRATGHHLDTQTQTLKNQENLRTQIYFVRNF